VKLVAAQNARKQGHTQQLLRAKRAHFFLTGRLTLLPDRGEVCTFAVLLKDPEYLSAGVSFAYKYGDRNRSKAP
jgi:hypothetical protein